MRLSFAVALFQTFFHLKAAEGSVIYETSFESGFSGWIGVGDVTVNSFYQDGSQSVRTGGSSSLERLIDTTSYTGVSLSLQWAAHLLETGENCHVWVTYNGGGSWNIVGTLTAPDDDDQTYRPLSFSDNQMDNNPNFGVKLGGTGAQTNDACYFDTISVSDGSGGGGGGSGGSSRVLSYDVLTGGTDPSSPVQMNEFVGVGSISAASNIFEGKLSFTSPGTEGQQSTIYDEFNYDNDPQRLHMPVLDAEMVQSASDELIPVLRSNQVTAHPFWETIAGVGQCWDEVTDNGYTRCSFPLTLTQKNANCVHQGVVTFLFKNDGSESKAYYQITSETCPYYKANMWGLLSVNYTPQTVTSKSTVLTEWTTEKSQRLLESNLDQVQTDFPGSDANVFRNDAYVAPAHRSGVGLVVNHAGSVKHYVDDFPTRFGNYPFPLELVMPSYSIAKTVWASVAFMALHNDYPSDDLPNALLQDFIPECTHSKWDDVTLQHAMRMATGVYRSANDMADENASIMTTDFFLVLSHADKINHLCNYRHYKDHDPNTIWVYRTADHYMVVTALEAFVKTKGYAGLDEYLDQKVWAPLHLSPAARGPRKTYDGDENPFGGWGMFLTGDDYAKWAKFLALDNGYIGNTKILDTTLYQAMMQENPVGAGISTTRGGGWVYENGMWAYPSAVSACSGQYLPASRGFGGISILYFKNAAWWIVRDDYDFADHGVIEQHVHGTLEAQC